MAPSLVLLTKPAYLDPEPCMSLELLRGPLLGKLSCRLMGLGLRTYGELRLGFKATVKKFSARYHNVESAER